MSRLVRLVAIAASLLVCQHAAFGQSAGADVEQLKKEIDLLKRELDLLRRENELLKRENAALQKGGAAKKTTSDAAARVTVDDVEYVYQGVTRNGARFFVTILATSQDGNQTGPNGSMTIIDDKGTKYVGRPAAGFGARPVLREGIPVKLVWEFGAPNAFTGGKGIGSAPSAKITRYAGVIIQPTVAGMGANTIDFRNVPAIVEARGKP